MATEVYNVNVSGDPPTLGNYFSTWPWPQSDNWNNYYSNWTYTNTIYLYQIICPRCNSQNWGEIDKVVQCKGIIPAAKRTRKQICNAKLKAIKEKVDFEVPVG